MKHIFISLLVITSLAYGCKKEHLSNQESSETEVILKNNSSNPYEYIGEEHNLALAHIISINSTNYTDAVSYISQSLNEPQSRFADWTIIQSGVNAAIADGLGEFNTLTNDPDIGSYLGNLKSILLNSNSTNIESNIAPLVNSILNASNGLSEENRTLLFATTALGKHSFVYWSNSQGSSGISNVWRDAVGFLQGFRLEWDNNLGLDGTAVKLGSSLLSGLGGAVIASGS